MKTILCIEDNPENLKVIRLMVHRLRPDEQFVSVRNAEEGLETARQIIPDLILMDIDLPGMSGFQALVELKRDALTCDIPVLAISAHAMQGDAEAGLLAGFEVYITKPFDMGNLKMILDRYLSSGIISEDVQLEHRACH